METRFIEATNVLLGRPLNWGKFAVGRFDPEEWARRALEEQFPMSLLARVGWDPKHVLVMDLQTGEAGIFLPGGSAKHDLQKHRLWVCPLFEPFLTWLYQQDLTNLQALPDKVTLDIERAPFLMYGHRRPGPPGELVFPDNRQELIAGTLIAVGAFAEIKAKDSALTKQELLEVLLMAASAVAQHDEVAEDNFLELAHKAFNTGLVRR